MVFLADVGLRDLAVPDELAHVGPHQRHRGEPLVAAQMVESIVRRQRLWGPAELGFLHPPGLHEPPLPLLPRENVAPLGPARPRPRHGRVGERGASTAEGTKAPGHQGTGAPA